MMQRLAHADELIDAPYHDREELEESLDHVAEVNRLLGGTRAVIRTLDRLIDARQPCSILDVGTGSADIPIAIDAWAHRHGIDISIVATDVHPQMREIAAERTRVQPRIRIEDANALKLPYTDAAFDIVLLSLALHHFDDDDQIRVLREASRVARHAVVVNELERCMPNYLGSRVMAATRWRHNRLTRHDGPVSVLRAFTRAELIDLATRAGLRVVSVRRYWFFRLVVVLGP